MVRTETSVAVLLSAARAGSMVVVVVDMSIADLPPICP